MGGDYSTHGKIGDAYKMLFGKSESKRALGKPKHNWRVNNKLDLIYIGYEGMKLIHLF
jgi:hypothetical protein